MLFTQFLVNSSFADFCSCFSDNWIVEIPDLFFELGGLMMANFNGNSFVDCHLIAGSKTETISESNCFDSRLD
jgi:hypothetical protein